MKRVQAIRSLDALAGGGGAFLAALAALAFLNLAAGALGPAAYAPIITLWSVVFLVQTALLVPAEQELARAIGSRGSATTVSLARAGLRLGLVIGGPALLLSLGLAWLGLDVLFGGSPVIAASLPLATAGFAAGMVVKGHAAGAGHLGRWSAFMVVDSVVRLGLAGLLVLNRVTDPAPYAVALAVAPLVGLAAMGGLLVRDLRSVEEGVAPIRPLVRGSLWLMLAGGGAALLSNGGTAAAAMLAQPGDAVVVGQLGVALLLARLPMFAFQAVSAAILPRLSARFTAGGGTATVGLLARLSFGLLLLGGLGSLIALLAGPLLVKLLLGPAYDVQGRTLALLTLSATFWLVGSLFTAGIVAAQRHGTAALVWALAAAGAVVSLFLAGPDLVTRIEVAMLVGSACAAGLAALAARRARGPRSGLATHGQI